MTALSGTIFLFVLPLGKAKKSRFEKFILKLIECSADLGKLRSAARKSFIVTGLFWFTTFFGVVTVALRWAPWISFVFFFKP